MRWHTARFGTDEEIEEQAEINQKIDRFWAQFALDSEMLTNNFFEDKVEQTVEWSEEYLKPIHEDLMWEAGRDILEPDNRRLVFTITPEDEYALRPLTKAIIERAPEIPNWRFTQFKEPLIGEFKEFTHSLLKHDWSTVEGQINENPLKCFDITLSGTHFRKENSPGDLGEAIMVLTTVLGEEPVDMWINFVMTLPKKKAVKTKKLDDQQKEEKEPDKKDGKSSSKKKKDDAVTAPVLSSDLTDQPPFYPLDSLRTMINSRVAELVDELPIECCWEREFEEFYSLKGNSWQPGQRPMITTPYPDTIFAKERRMLFHSAAFTRHEEVFAYLKMEMNNPSNEDLEDRYELEDQLDEKLRAAKAGCVLGGGSGSDAAYVDMMISDLDAATKIMRSMATRLNLPTNSWLLFYDTYWVDEWVGMFNDTPAPEPHDVEQW